MLLLDVIESPEGDRLPTSPITLGFMKKVILKFSLYQSPPPKTLVLVRADSSRVKAIPRNILTCTREKNNFIVTLRESLITFNPFITIKMRK